MRPAALLAVLGAAVAVAAGADEVFLEGGGRISGVIVERSTTTLVLETAPGRVGVPLARVKRIVTGNSALDEYRTRRQALLDDDVAGWLALARWSDAHGLGTQSREAFERVVRLDPSQSQAQTALGREQVDGRWLTATDAQRARGLVEFEGRWVAPEERQQLVEERSTSAREAREQAESEARIREAEARARAAEAEARRAEAEAQAARESATRVAAPVLLGGVPGVFDPYGNLGPSACANTPCAPTHVHGEQCGHTRPTRPHNDPPVVSARPSGTGIRAPTPRPRPTGSQDRP